MSCETAEKEMHDISCGVSGGGVPPALKSLPKIGRIRELIETNSSGFLI
jgi:hypothetical protein